MTLRRFDHLAGTQARCADADAFPDAVDDGADAMEVRIPAAERYVVGVTDVIAELGALTAKITFPCH